MQRLLLPALLLAACLTGANVLAESDAPLPVITIIIDDLGYQWDGGKRVVDLPGPIACSVLPHTPYGSRLARAAHRAGKEVMLHLPMQPSIDKDPGHGALLLDTSESELGRLLTANLAAVPHAVGINNHMGSLLTRHPGHMAWLMRGLREHPSELFFVDSLTSQDSVALQLAREHDVPAAGRDLFLDREQNEAAITAQLTRLVELAHERGSAMAIGHPYPETLTVLERELPALHERGVLVVGVAEFIRRDAKENSRWQLSLSPSPRDSKN